MEIVSFYFQQEVDFGVIGRPGEVAVRRVQEDFYLVEDQTLVLVLTK